MQLKKGDPCRVRLHTGEVVDAVYDEPIKDLYCCHHLNVGTLIAIGGNTLRSRIKHKSMLDHECVFVGPACVLVPVGVSV